MPYLRRQKTDPLSISLITLLCLASSLLMGFSKPNAELFALLNTQPQTQPLIEADSMPVAVPQRRPVTFSANNLIQPVLGGIDYRYWLEPSRELAERETSERETSERELPGLELSEPSELELSDSSELSEPELSERELADLAQNEGQVTESMQFHGVGFPNIRTYRKTYSPTSFQVDKPSNWNLMIAWRTYSEDEQRQEPIAHVRCMGLSPQAVANRADRYDELIVETAREYEVSVNLVKAIVTKESCFNSEALSPVGAQGLMQLMPETARWLKVKDSLDPVDNLRAGVRYIASLQKEFDSLELVLAAYNAGPGNVRRYKGVPPFSETLAYVQSVKAHFRRYTAATQMELR